MDGVEKKVIREKAQIAKEEAEIKKLLEKQQDLKNEIEQRKRASKSKMKKAERSQRTHRLIILGAKVEKIIKNNYSEFDLSKDDPEFFESNLDKIVATIKIDKGQY